MEIKLVPEGYTQLEYIEQPLGNSGYIKTGINASNTIGFTIEFETHDYVNTSSTTNAFGVIFGARYTKANAFLLGTYRTTAGGELKTGTSAKNPHIVKDTKIKCSLFGNTYQNGEFTETVTRNASHFQEIYLFCNNTAGTVEEFGHYKLYSLKFIDNGVTLRHFIPCINPDSVVGLYDRVSKGFFTSANDVVFTAGPVKTITLTAIAEKAIEVNYIKEDLRSAINEHYGTEELVYSDGLVEYANAIDNIDTSNYTLPTEPKAVNFIDYDGTLLYAYTASEFQAMEGLPRNPWHSGLIAQGWNWTREEILDYLTRAERIDVGQMYITNDGATRYYIHKDNPDYLDQALVFYQGKANGVLISWGDGTSERFTGTGTKTVTHTYSTIGNYVISLLPDEDCTFQLTGRGDTYAWYTYTDSTVFGAYYNTSDAWKLMQECFKVELGKGLTGISPCAFRYFTNLKTISIPKNVTTFGGGCLYLCYDLKCIIFPRNPERPIIVRDSACRSTFALDYICTSTTWSSAFCGTYGFNACRAASILIPDSCNSFGAYSFEYLRSLKYIYISRNLTSIPSIGIGACEVLQRINLQNVTTYSDSLRDLPSLQYIKFPEGTTTIPQNCVIGGYSLFEIDLPSTITSIGSQSFNYCFNIRRIIVRATTPPTLGNVNAFHGAYVTNSGADYRSIGGRMGHFYVPYSEDHSILQAYLDSDATTSWGYYLTFNCPITELNPDGTIPEEDWE